MVLACLILVTLIYLVECCLDFMYFTLPNKLFYALFYLFPFYVFASTNYPLLYNYGLFLIFVVIGFILFALSLFEAGDAKLLAVSTLWVGWHNLIVFLLVMSLLGGVIGLSYVYSDVYIHRFAKTCREIVKKNPFLSRIISFFVANLQIMEAKIAQMQERRLIPYGIAISLATILVLWGVYSG
ncbi:MAG TPA: prepilin peptidase [Candidatus Nitrosotenuis sp.]|nr:prepilin peptidase [Candidatus Nitrosotenuis sp.]